jgi:hypothetical protein
MATSPHGWTHAMCNRCWYDTKPGREPVKVRDPKAERCCFCGRMSAYGVYVRRDPDAIELKCNKD